MVTLGIRGKDGEPEAAVGVCEVSSDTRSLVFDALHKKRRQVAQHRFPKTGRDRPWRCHSQDTRLILKDRHLVVEYYRSKRKRNASKVRWDLEDLQMTSEYTSLACPPGRQSCADARLVCFQSPFD